MRNFFIALSVLSLVACGNTKKTENTAVEKVSNHLESEKSTNDGYASFGEEINIEQAVSSEEMFNKYKNLKIGDTLEVKFSAKVTEVCKKKGCFMRLSLPEGKETMVKFKDYAFFMPKDIEEKEAVVHGKAFITVIPVKEQKHYAKDAGKSEAEIAAITQPKRTLSFIADGVLIKQ